MSPRTFINGENASLKAPVRDETLRKMFPQQCCSVCAHKKHLLRQQNVSEKVQKHLLLLERKKRFRNIFLQCAQTGNVSTTVVSSFAGDSVRKRNSGRRTCPHTQKNSLKTIIGKRNPPEN